MTKIEITSPKPSAVVSQQTAEQVRFFGITERATASDVLDWLHLIRSKTPDHSQPQGIRVRWHGAFTGIEVKVAEDRRFRAGKMTFPVADGKTSTLIHSLKCGTQYFLRVTGVDVNGKRAVSDTIPFATADELPRWIRVNGVSNVRDCGGWHTKYGKKVKQGLLIRGGEMNRHMTIKPSGADFLENQLRIRTDFDMRMQEELDNTPSHGPALSPKVRWINIPIRPYWEIFSDLQKGYYARGFRLLLKKIHFPIYFHCWGGADRTGIFTLLINAILGVPDNDLLRDYELTSLGVWGERSRYADYFTRFMTDLEPYAPNQDFEAKALAYFKSCGITDTEIQELKNLLLE